MKFKSIIFFAFCSFSLLEANDNKLSDLAGAFCGLREKFATKRNLKKIDLEALNSRGEGVEYTLSNGKKIFVLTGNIQNILADVVVDAANSNLIPGAGISKGLFMASSVAPSLEEWKKAKPANFETGKAFLNRKEVFIKNTKARIVHAVGPSCLVRDAMSEKERLMLSDAYKNSLKSVEEGNKKGENLKSIVFPSISTGIFGCNFFDASNVALEIVINYLLSIEGNSINKLYFLFWSGEEKKQKYEPFITLLEKKLGL